MNQRTLHHVETALDCLHDQQRPASQPACRRVLRYAACLIPAEVSTADAAVLLRDAANHPALTLADVLSALHEDDGAESTEALREDANAVRDLARVSPASALRALRRDERLTTVAAWLAVVENRTVGLSEAAARRAANNWITVGVDGTPAGADPDAADLEEFAERHGISIRYAATLLKRAVTTDEARQSIEEAQSRIGG